MRKNLCESNEADCAQANCSFWARFFYWVELINVLYNWSLKSGGPCEWQCPTCNFIVSRVNEFALRAGIKSHQETHEQKKRWQCEFCSKQFRFKDGWQGHMNTHRGIYPYECLPCHKVWKLHFAKYKAIQRYPSRSLLTQHFLRSTAHRDNRDLKLLFETVAKITDSEVDLK